MRVDLALGAVAVVASVVATVGPTAGCADTRAPARDGAAMADMTPPPVTLLVGEIHLHEFPAGGHAAAAFVAEPVARAGAGDDALYDLGYPLAATDGACELHVAPHCSGGCPGHSWCASDERCVPLPTPTWIDAGVIAVAGSSVAPSLRLAFDAGQGGYVSDPPPGPPLFAAGDVLRVTDGAPGYRLDVPLAAPPKIALAMPDPSSPLVVPASGPLELRWTAAPGPWRFLVTLAASSDTTLAAAVILCRTDDSGVFTVPASLVGRLPPAPRDVHLQLERAASTIAPTDTPGVGAIVHAGNVLLVDG